MLFNRNIHIVSHTHWDREWYFTTCDSLVLLDQTVSDILKELNENKNVNFSLDGQVSILEDYLKLYPEKLANIQSLVKEKRLFIGPWYTQTDTQLVSGQSIVGNLYYGIYRSLQLVKGYMKIGYLPDTFGFSNQMPMLMQQFGIDNFIFWRGSDFKKQQIEPYFKWLGQDNSEVVGVVLHNGYGMAKGLNTSDLFVNKKLKPLIEEYKELTTTKDILIPVGNDQNNIVKSLDQKTAAISSDLLISTYEDFVKAVKPQITTSYKGEFREVPYSRIHKTSGAIRMDIKKSNYVAEMELIKVVEPLNVMAKMENIAVSNNLIQEAWKLLYEGQAHDGIIGCVSDTVASDILNRNKQALEIGKSTENYLKKHFAQKIDLKKNEILVFNLDVEPFKGYKEIEIFSHSNAVEVDGVTSQSIVESQKFEGYDNALVEKPEGNYYEVEEDYFLHKVLIEVELPSFGFCTLTYKEVEHADEKETNDLSICNQSYKITFQDANIVLEKGSQKVEQFISLYDCGNDGDTYDFSPLAGDKEFELSMLSAKVEKRDNVQTMEIDCDVHLPYDLKERKNGSFDNLCKAKIQISLRKDDLIRTKVVFDNQVLSHRLRIAFRGFEATTKTIAATPFGSVTRDVLNGGVSKDWQEAFVEYPVDIETNSGFVSFAGKGEQLTVFNKGVKEYQAINDAIYMTLFSTCDELGKPDLLYRPGRASGDTTKKGHIRMATPLAQLQSEQTFEFAVTFMENDDYACYKQLQVFESPNVFYQDQKINLFYERIDNKIQLHESDEKLEKKQSYLQLDADVLVSSIYTSLYDQQWKLRVMSFKDIEKNEIKFNQSFRLANLLEEGDEQKLKAYRLYTMKG